jgi:hypothetical protein
MQTVVIAVDTHMVSDAHIYMANTLYIYNFSARAHTLRHFERQRRNTVVHVWVYFYSQPRQTMQQPPLTRSSARFALKYARSTAAAAGD